MPKEAQAHKLLGLELPGGWKVTAKHERTDGASGGRYSVCYLVERNGTRAFLKALDFSRVQEAPDFVRALQAVTEAFNFERDLVQSCYDHRMDRVVSPLADGAVVVDDSYLGKVHYIIFEAADCDVRTYVAKLAASEITWKLRALHHITTGLHQLHTAGIAHQDIKPSNIVIFGPESKVADLGRASLKGVQGPSDGERYPGDKTYAPLELMYDYLDPDFNMRRFGCDLYLLGSMVTFLFGGIGATAAVLSHLHSDHLPENWHGKYAEVLPYVRNAFGLAVQNFGEHLEGAQLRTELVETVTQLCEPDPALRGHPNNRIGIGNRFSLERFISRFDRLATRSRLGLLKK